MQKIKEFGHSLRLPPGTNAKGNKKGRSPPTNTALPACHSAEKPRIDLPPAHTLHCHTPPPPCTATLNPSGDTTPNPPNAFANTGTGTNSCHSPPKRRTAVAGALSIPPPNWRKLYEPRHHRRKLAKAPPPQLPAKTQRHSTPPVGYCGQQPRRFHQSTSKNLMSPGENSNGPATSGTDENSTPQP